MKTNWAVFWTALSAVAAVVAILVTVVQNWSQIKKELSVIAQDLNPSERFQVVNSSGLEICTVEVAFPQAVNSKNLLPEKLSLKAGESLSFMMPLGTYQFTARNCDGYIVDRATSQSVVQAKSDQKWAINSTWFILPVSNKTNSSICYLWFKPTSSSNWQNHLSQQLDPGSPNPSAINLPAGTYDIAVGDCQSQPTTLQLRQNISLTPGKLNQWDITTTATSTPPTLVAPDQVVKNYFSYLDKQQHNQAWSLWSEDGRQNKYLNDYTRYLDRWHESDNFSVQNIEVSYPTPSTAQVIADVKYNQYEATACHHLIHKLILDSTSSNWLIEDISFDRGC